MILARNYFSGKQMNKVLVRTGVEGQEKARLRQELLAYGRALVEINIEKDRLHQTGYSAQYSTVQGKCNRARDTFEDSVIHLKKEKRDELETHAKAVFEETVNTEKSWKQKTAVIIKIWKSATLWLAGYLTCMLGTMAPELKTLREWGTMTAVMLVMCGVPSIVPGIFALIHNFTERARDKAKDLESSIRWASERANVLEVHDCSEVEK